MPLIFFTKSKYLFAFNLYKIIKVLETEPCSSKHTYDSGCQFIPAGHFTFTNSDW